MQPIHLGRVPTPPIASPAAASTPRNGASRKMSRSRRPSAAVAAAAPYHPMSPAAAARNGHRAARALSVVQAEIGVRGAADLSAHPSGQAATDSDGAAAALAAHSQLSPAAAAPASMDATSVAAAADLPHMLHVGGGANSSGCHSQPPSSPLDRASAGGDASASDSEMPMEQEAASSVGLVEQQQQQQTMIEELAAGAGRALTMTN